MQPFVVSYARFSSAGQKEGTSLARQAEYAAEWAAAHGMKLDMSLRDEGLSAYKQTHVKRGALGAFLKTVQQGKVPAGSVLVVEALDRLSRAEALDAQGQLRDIISAGITVVTAKDGKAYSRKSLRDNPMDLIFSTLLMIRANEESERKAGFSRDAMRARCKAFLAGDTSRRVHGGDDPAWIRLDGHKRELVPERVAAVHAALDLFKRGYGIPYIAKALTERGMELTDAGSNEAQVTRLVRNRALLGEKTMTIKGRDGGADETFVLPGYYPALLKLDAWQELQDIVAGRAIGRNKGSLPHVLTGLGITTCGYCGCPVIAQVRDNERDEDGLIADRNRRLRCSHTMRPSVTCAGGKPSIRTAPVERAIMTFCSDMMNLQSLFTDDREAGPRAALLAARSRATNVAKKVAALGEAIVEAKLAGLAVTSLLKKTAALEAEHDELKAAVAKAERELARVARADLTGLDKRWAKLVDGVLAQQVEPRLQARLLVQDTFERIIIYHSGVSPKETPKGIMDVVLLAKGGVERLLRINSKGEWLASETVSARAA